MASAKRKTTSRKTTSRKPKRNPALARLRRRTADLAVDYITAGRATPTLQESVRRLRRDVDSWRGDTGRKDIGATAMQLRNNDDGWTCDRCEWIMFSTPPGGMGRICFLVGCDPEWNNCSYICITLPRDPDYPVA